MQKLQKEIQPYRVQMKEHERTSPWLSMLFDCYAVIDLSVAKAVAKAEQKPVCHEGCTPCCQHIIPLSTLECLGLKWYVQTILSKENQTLLREKLQKRKNGQVLPTHGELCLFNCNGSCMVYPVRPIACRRFLVAGKACEMGEDTLTMRPQDMIKPAREYLYAAIAKTLPFYTAINIPRQEHEDIFTFYRRQNVILAEIYDKIIV